VDELLHDSLDGLLNSPIPLDNCPMLVFDLGDLTTHGIEILHFAIK
jgi:hypothetical protein